MCDDSLHLEVHLRLDGGEFQALDLLRLSGKTAECASRDGEATRCKGRGAAVGSLVQYRGKIDGRCPHGNDSVAGLGRFIVLNIHAVKNCVSKSSAVAELVAIKDVAISRITLDFIVLANIIFPVSGLEAERHGLGLLDSVCKRAA